MNNFYKWCKYFSLLIFYISGQTTEFQGNFQVGHHIGRAIEISVTAFDFAQGLPFAVKLGFDHSIFDPGNAIEARRIFINNNQGGTIKENGWIMGARLDFLFPVQILDSGESFVYVGLRNVSFKGNFKYIGNNEDFDVVSKHWGMGLGTQSGFTISRKVQLLITGGIEYYSPSTLYGHDTYYSPNGEYNNQRENYVYRDADNAINQPKLEFLLMLGVSYHFGK
jgi:hypothetical protein